MSIEREAEKAPLSLMILEVKAISAIIPDV
jgi:hypothetical protein